MKIIQGIDWQALLIPDTPLLEIFIRGSLTYLALLFLLRMILKRQAGTVGMSDLLVMVLIADAAQNGMADDYKSLPDGILLVATLIFWNFALEWLGYHFPRLERFLHPDPLPLIQNGQMIEHAMKRELITESELLSQLRQQGIRNLGEVERAYLEGDGHISVICYEKQEHKNKGRETLV